MLDADGQTATTQEEVAGIAQKFFAKVEAAQITSLDKLLGEYNACSVTKQGKAEPDPELIPT
eukprot:8622350-Pyramimonas_sp.AAC.1